MSFIQAGLLIVVLACICTVSFFLIEPTYKATFENNQEAQAQAQSAADSKKQTFGVCFLDT